MIRTLQENEVVPLALMKLADDEAKILTYLSVSEVFVLEENQQIIGSCVVKQQSPTTYEVMNLAIAKNQQNQGYGEKLLSAVIQIVRKQKAKVLTIATADTSLPALHLYQKLGFQQVAVVRNYFMTHYPAPIFEAGRQCMDQIQLQLMLSSG
ncbi:GNAT family N-acetyltransferase [Isobaculum melis]|uniref:Ribosomal protein S18 acetylase RimI n=1 Tax=Isobaculum melis TaxID=142588 RepID=A0A1H9QJ21_9LACT|nr:GNAT family N-acetyltransferase [Isobaculum melis]SER60440.1 Ribosomal protein S18 acetylase RimI [Isobaculum melis]